jgi:hypothetical protein
MKLKALICAVVVLVGSTSHVKAADNSSDVLLRKTLTVFAAACMCVSVTDITPEMAVQLGAASSILCSVQNIARGRTNMKPLANMALVVISFLVAQDLKHMIPSLWG